LVFLLSAAPACAHAAVRVEGSPALFPSFKPSVRTYVAHCRPGKPLRLSFSLPAGRKVEVDRRKARGGSFTSTLRLGDGQAVRFATGGGHYLVRCLPPDFPGWTTARPGSPQAAWYLVAPCCTDEHPYVAVFDTNGVPVWWINTRRPPLDASLLSNDHIVWAQRHGTDLALGISAGVYEEHRLDGRRVRTFSIPDGTPTDRHEMQLLPNGDYVVVGYKPRSGVDLSPYGGPSDATVLDALIEEVSPQHKIVWRWNSKDHIGLTETGRWYQQGVFKNTARLPDGSTAYDIVHINAVERYGAGHFLVSLRHTDAVYDVARSDGHVVWKLGGTPTPQSLQIVGDDVSDFGGQHDVRVLPDGTVTLHDNGTGLVRFARALRFRIDASAGTATLLEQITDPFAAPSPCCGSARKLPGGHWVISWGGTDLITEETPAGKPVFSLSFPALLSYRAFPVLPHRLKRSALYAGMDAMHPRR
jgi:hypothetical protein